MGRPIWHPPVSLLTESRLIKQICKCVYTMPTSLTTDPGPPCFSSSVWVAKEFDQGSEAGGERYAHTHRGVDETWGVGVDCNVVLF